MRFHWKKLNVLLKPLCTNNSVCLNLNNFEFWLGSDIAGRVMNGCSTSTTMPVPLSKIRNRDPTV